jgi:hypothetical protein
MYATQTQKVVKANPEFRFQDCRNQILCLKREKNPNSKNLKLRKTVVLVGNTT